MALLMWFGAGLYAAAMGMMWCLVYVGQQRTPLAAWAVASLFAIFWPVMIALCYVATTADERRSNRESNRMSRRFDQIEREFNSQSPTATPESPAPTG